MTGRSVGALAGMYERGMRVRLRDRLWEIEEIRGAGPGTFIDLRRADERPGPVRLTVVAALEPSLQPEPPASVRFDVGNPVHLAELHNALALTMAHGRGDLLAVEHGQIDVEPYQLVPVLAGLRQPRKIPSERQAAPRFARRLEMSVRPASLRCPCRLSCLLVGGSRPW